mgnify:CR=1 FL=1
MIAAEILKQQEARRAQAEALGGPAAGTLDAATCVSTRLKMLELVMNSMDRLVDKLQWIDFDSAPVVSRPAPAASTATAASGSAAANGPAQARAADAKTPSARTPSDSQLFDRTTSSPRGGSASSFAVHEYAELKSVRNLLVERLLIATGGGASVAPVVGASVGS